MEKETRIITVLLTKYSDPFSKWISFVGKGYSHASLSIDESEEIFYSFNRKGFVTEKVKKYRPRTREEDSVCIRMQVPLKTYDNIKEQVDDFILHKKDYKYSLLGVFLCIAHIPYKTKNKYFCTQFVTEVLLKAGAVDLDKKETLFLPSELLSSMKCRYSTLQFVYNVI